MAASAPQVAAFAAVLLFLPSLLAPAAAQQANAKAFCISQFAIASQACSILPPSPPEEEDHDDDDDDDGDDDDEGDRRVRARRGHAKMISVSSLSSLLANNNDSSGVHGRDGTGAHSRNGTGRHHGNHTSRGRGRGRGRGGRLGDGGDADQGGDDEDPDHDDDHNDDQDPDHDDDHDDDQDPDHEDDDDDNDDDDDDDDDQQPHHNEELRAYRDCCRWLQEVQKDCVCQALLRLPPFLVKPQHKYVVRVGRTCRIVYRCGGV